MQELTGLPLERAESLLKGEGIAYVLSETTPPRGSITKDFSNTERRVIRVQEKDDEIIVTWAEFISLK